jgi:uncharacterized membrane protein YhdT
MAELARNRMTPLWIGLLVIVVTDAVTAYLFLTRTCAAGIPSEVSALLLVLIFVVLPVIYLALMYLTLKSQP